MAKINIKQSSNLTNSATGTINANGTKSNFGVSSLTELKSIRSVLTKTDKTTSEILRVVKSLNNVARSPFNKDKGDLFGATEANKILKSQSETTRLAGIVDKGFKSIKDLLGLNKKESEKKKSNGILPFLGKLLNGINDFFGRPFSFLKGLGPKLLGALAPLAKLAKLGLILFFAKKMWEWATDFADWFKNSKLGKLLGYGPDDTGQLRTQTLGVVGGIGSGLNEAGKYIKNMALAAKAQAEATKDFLKSTKFMTSAQRAAAAAKNVTLKAANDLAAKFRVLGKASSAYTSKLVKLGNKLAQSSKNLVSSLGKLTSKVGKGITSLAKYFSITNPTSIGGKITRTVTSVAGGALKAGGNLLRKIAWPLQIISGSLEAGKAYLKGDNKKARAAIAGTAGSMAGGFAGAKAGMAAGALIGSVIPGVGTAIGAGIGGLLGGALGSMAGDKLSRKTSDVIYDYNHRNDQLNQEEVQLKTEQYNSLLLNNDNMERNSLKLSKEIDQARNISRGYNDNIIDLLASIDAKLSNTYFNDGISNTVGSLTTPTIIENKRM